MSRQAEVRPEVRHLVLVLGDQLDRAASVWDGFDPALDLAWMAEASEESTHVWSSKQRIVLFLSAMRHFAQALRADGVPLRYLELKGEAPAGSLADALKATLCECRVERVLLTQPGDWRVLQALREAVGDTPLDIREDRHFLCSVAEFAAHASGRKQLRMEYFYREMRRRHSVLMDADQPVGGEWNFDAENRAAFGKNGPGFVPETPRFAPDATIGLMGISFSGGLSIVAAGRPSLHDKVAYVFAFGGHGDLPRVLRYLCTGQVPPPGATAMDARIAGEPRTPPPPHDYGLAVLLFGLADRVVPTAQVGPLKGAVLRFLLASALDRNDKPGAAREFSALRTFAPTLPEPSSTLLTYVNDRDVVHLGARLLPFIGAYGGDAPALSASRAPKPAAPVFLLHGLADNVIPADESVELADELRGHAPVRLLLSALISHAETDRPAGAGDVLRLAGFWGDLLTR